MMAKGKEEGRSGKVESQEVEGSGLRPRPKALHIPEQPEESDVARDIPKTPDRPRTGGKQSEAIVKGHSSPSASPPSPAVKRIWEARSTPPPAEKVTEKRTPLSLRRTKSGTKKNSTNSELLSDSYKHAASLSILPLFATPLLRYDFVLVSLMGEIKSEEIKKQADEISSANQDSPVFIKTGNKLYILGKSYQDMDIKTRQTPKTGKLTELNNHLISYLSFPKEFNQPRKITEDQLPLEIFKEIVSKRAHRRIAEVKDKKQIEQEFKEQQDKALSEIKLMDGNLPDNQVRLVEMTKENIKEHFIRRIELFFYTLVAYYGTRVTVALDRFPMQHGEGRNGKDRTQLTDGCHSSFFPKLVDEHSFCSGLAGESILGGTHFAESISAVVELPKVINYIDINFFDGQNIDKLSPLRARALKILNEVSGAANPSEVPKDPIMGLSELLREMGKEFSQASMRNAFTGDTNTASRAARDRVLPILRSILPEKNDAKDAKAEEKNPGKLLSDHSSVTDEYIHLLLRMSTEECSNWRNSDVTQKREIYKKKILQLQGEILNTPSTFVKKNEMFSWTIEQIQSKVGLDCAEADLKEAKQLLKEIVDQVTAIQAEIVKKQKELEQLLKLQEAIKKEKNKEAQEPPNEEELSSNLEKLSFSEPEPRENNKKAEQLTQQIIETEKDVLKLQQQKAQILEIQTKIQARLHTVTYYYHVALAKYHHLQGVVLAQKNRFQEALPHYQEAIKLSPNQPDYYLDTAEAYYHVKNYADAHTHYEKGTELALNKITPYLWNRKGNILCELDRFSEAIVVFETALIHVPNDSNVISNLERARRSLVQQQKKASSLLAQPVSNPMVQLSQAFGAQLHIIVPPASSPSVAGDAMNPPSVPAAGAPPSADGDDDSNSTTDEDIYEDEGDEKAAASASASAFSSSRDSSRLNSSLSFFHSSIQQFLSPSVQPATPPTLGADQLGDLKILGINTADKAVIQLISEDLRQLETIYANCYLATEGKPGRPENAAYERLHRSNSLSLTPARIIEERITDDLLIFGLIAASAKLPTLLEAYKQLWVQSLSQGTQPRTGITAAYERLRHFNKFRFLPAPQIVGEQAEQIILEISEAEIKKAQQMEQQLAQEAAKKYRLTLHNVLDKGNCFFDSVGDQLKQRYGIGLSADRLRSIAMQQMQQKPARYAGSLSAEQDFNFSYVSLAVLEHIKGFIDLDTARSMLTAAALEYDIPIKEDVSAWSMDQIFNYCRRHSNAASIAVLTHIVFPSLTPVEKVAAHANAMMQNVSEDQADSKEKAADSKETAYRKWADDIDVLAMSDALGISIISVQPTGQVSPSISSSSSSSSSAPSSGVAAIAVKTTLHYYNQSNELMPIVIAFTGRNHYQSLHGNPTKLLAEATTAEGQRPGLASPLMNMKQLRELAEKSSSSDSASSLSVSSSHSISSNNSFASKGKAEEKDNKESPTSDAVVRENSTSAKPKDPILSSKDDSPKPVSNSSGSSSNSPSNNLSPLKSEEQKAIDLYKMASRCFQEQKPNYLAATLNLIQESLQDLPKTNKTYILAVDLAGRVCCRRGIQFRDKGDYDQAFKYFSKGRDYLKEMSQLPESFSKINKHKVDLYLNKCQEEIARCAIMLIEPCREEGSEQCLMQ